MSDTSKINEIGSTGLMIGHMRAVEGSRPDKLFEDPIAAAFHNEQIAATVDTWDRQFAAFSSILRVRLRWMDDVVSRCLAQGIDQVVEVGAGCCTRAQRLVRPNVTFYEIDQPEVLAFKIDRLASAGHPYGAVGIGMDYTLPGALEALLTHGLDPGRTTLVVWEGNTFYLPDDVIRAVMRTLCDILPNIVLAVDYLGPEVIRGESASPWMRAQAQRLKNLGAPWVGSIGDIHEIAAELGLHVDGEESFQSLMANLLPHIALGVDGNVEYGMSILRRR